MNKILKGTLMALSLVMASVLSGEVRAGLFGGSTGGTFRMPHQPDLPLPRPVEEGVPSLPSDAVFSIDPCLALSEYIRGKNTCANEGNCLHISIDISKSEGGCLLKSKSERDSQAEAIGFLNGWNNGSLHSFSFSDFDHPDFYQDDDGQITLEMDVKSPAKFITYEQYFIRYLRHSAAQLVFDEVNYATPLADLPTAPASEENPTEMPTLAGVNPEVTQNLINEYEKCLQDPICKASKGGVSMEDDTSWNKQKEATTTDDTAKDNDPPIINKVPPIGTSEIHASGEGCQLNPSANNSGLNFILGWLTFVGVALSSVRQKLKR